MASDEIYIRQYRPSDLPQVRALLYESFVTRGGSVAANAKRSFLFKAPNIAAYFLAACGGGVLYNLPHWDNVAGVLGAFLLLMGLGIVFAIRRAITNGAKGLYKKALAADMLDVEKHYGAPAAFFVAARPKEGDKKSDDGEQAEEVVGYVGLEYFPDKKTHTAEVRRMTVSAKHRRQGLATRLIRAVVTHAESVRGLDSIELGTSEFQSSARYLFEKLGWEFQKTDEEWVGFVSATIFRFRRAVETKKRR